MLKFNMINKQELSIDKRYIDLKIKIFLFFLEYKLMRSCDLKKDQSFFLCHMNKTVLPYVEFPVGSMMKTTVKQLAQELNLDRIARKDESK